MASQERKDEFAAALTPAIDKVYGALAKIQDGVSRGDIASSDTGILRAFRNLDQLFEAGSEVADALYAIDPDFAAGHAAATRALERARGIQGADGVNS